MSYISEFKKIEEFSKNLWKKIKVSQVFIDHSKEKEVILDFFPYPSGVGLHVGHPLGYIATDIYARFKKLQGKNVLYAMGYDAFGLPAEQYAIETGKHPSIITNQNIENIRRQLEILGLNHDENRTFSTTDPDYYKWTQSIFLKLYNSYFDEVENKAKHISFLEEKFKKEGYSDDEIYFLLNQSRLAYLDQVKVNWCPKLGTVLSNEEVIGGLSERGSFPVIQKNLKQWVLRITKYSHRLIEKLDELDWPKSVKEMQKNWIGNSVGYEIYFETEVGLLEIYTTRPETLNGATYCAISSEHPEIKKFYDGKIEEGFCGIKTDKYAINPLNNKKIPIYIAEYVLPYATCAVMGVPANDKRDYDFAKKFNIEILPAILPDDEYLKQNQISLEEYLKNIKNYPCFEGKKEKHNYENKNWIKEKKFCKLRDWIFSRQRYWGEPFPIVLDKKGNPYGLEESALPIELPFMEHIKFSMESDEVYKPLDDCLEWKNVFFIKLNNSTARIIKKEEKADYENAGYEIFEGTRETNTMPNWAGSCWYYLRYMDSKNNTDFIGQDAKNYWEKPKKIGAVDLYLGGAEHAVLHLLYARFWHMVLYDLNLVNSPEPFQRLFNQGMILGSVYKNSDGKYFSYKDIRKIDQTWYSISTNEPLLESIGKIGKRYKNGITPEEVCEEYSVDAFRLFMMFLGPLEQNKPWDYKAINGMVRLLEKVWNIKIIEKVSNETLFNFDLMLEKIANDFQNLKFNTAISEFNIFLNENNSMNLDLYRKILIILSPMAPHLAEFLYKKTFHNYDSIFQESWPEKYEVFFEKEEVNLIIALNGKKKDVLVVKAKYNFSEIEEIVLNYCNKNNINHKKIIIPPKREHWMVNIVL